MAVPRGDFPKLVFEGRITTPIGREGDPVVTMNGKPINQRQDLQNHSQGVSWGFGGAGPHQLALTLTAHSLGDVVGKECSFIVLDEIVKKLDKDKGWVLTEYDIWMCIRYHSTESGAFLEKHGRYPL